MPAPRGPFARPEEAEIDSFLPDRPDETPRRLTFAREWIIFAISMGLGGHVALGIVLHAPEVWPWEEAGRYAVMVGFSVYVAVLLSRAAARIIRAKRRPFP